MTALAADREDGAHIGPILDLDYPVVATDIVFQGAAVGRDAAGNVGPMVVSTTLVAVGRASEQVDNAAGAINDLRVPVESGIFLMKNSTAGEEVRKQEVGLTVFAVDDQTVGRTNAGATLSAMGVVVQLLDETVTDGDVFVRIGPEVQPT